MAGASLLTLIDDIAALLDDVATLTKVATKKTAGVLGDDLALNAQQVAGVSTDRELPVVWKVAIRSLANKAILVPAALVLSAVAHWAVQPLLMAGGLFLCFEGAEKLLHAKQANAEAPVQTETERVSGAVRTDFILSAEIIIIALGSVAEAPFDRRLLTLVAISLVMTVGVYGIVAGIVKLDDLGLWLLKKGRLWAGLGRALLVGTPWLMRGLSVAGTVAMFLVGGGILSHGIPPVHHLVQPLGKLPTMAIEGVLGVASGLVCVGLMHVVQRLRRPAQS
jgi:uncharacterized protein